MSVLFGRSTLASDTEYKNYEDKSEQPPQEYVEGEEEPGYHSDYTYHYPAEDTNGTLTMEPVCVISMFSCLCLKSPLF